MLPQLPNNITNSLTYIIRQPIPSRANWWTLTLYHILTNSFMFAITLIWSLLKCACPLDTDKYKFNYIVSLFDIWMWSKVTGRTETHWISMTLIWTLSKIKCHGVNRKVLHATLIMKCPIYKIQSFDIQWHWSDL